MDYITTTKVAAALGVTVRTVQRHIESGQITAIKYGRDFLVTKEELERFKQARRHVGRPRKKVQLL